MLDSYRNILKIAMPAAVNSLLDMLQVMIDLLMVGTLGAWASAAVGFGLQSVMFVFGLIAIFHVGTSAIISRYVGRNMPLRASIALGAILKQSLYASVLLAAIWYLLAPWGYELYGLDLQVIAQGQPYVKILTIAMALLVIKTVFVSAYSAYSNTLTPMLIKLFSILLNAALNYLLIFGHMGFDAYGCLGAGYATVVAIAVEVGIYLWLYLKGKSYFIPMLRGAKSVSKRLYRVGVAASMERLFNFGSFMLFGYVIARYSLETFSGYQIGLRIEGLAFMPGIGFSVAAMTLVGQALGKKDTSLAIRAAYRVMVLAIGVMFTISLGLYGYAKELSALFTNSAEVIEKSSIYLKIVALSQIPLAIHFVLSGALRGAGATKTTLKIGLGSIWAMRIIPSMLLWHYGFSIAWVYVAMISDTFMKATLAWYMFKKGSWQRVRV